MTLSQRWRPGGTGGTQFGHGASVYDAAFVLADYCFRSGHSFEGKRVVELGTGPGLVALAAGLLGASEVIATDGDSELLQLTEENFDLNISCPKRSSCRCETLVWGDAAAAQALNPPFDVVLAADVAAVVYEKHFPDLVSSLVSLTSETSVVLLSYHRRHRAEDGFFSLLREKFSLESIPSKAIHPDFSTAEITIYQLRRKKHTTESGAEEEAHDRKWCAFSAGTRQ